MTKSKLGKALLKIKYFLKKQFCNRSKEYYLGLVSLLILLLSSYFLIIIFISFDNQDFKESENVFFSGIILEPTTFNDYRDHVQSLSYDSISKERKQYIELYTINSPISRLDSIKTYLNGYKYNHKNKEDEIISIESNYFISDTAIVFGASFRLNEFINEKNKSDFKRKITFLVRPPQNKQGSLYSEFTKDDKKFRVKHHGKIIDYVTANQMFEIEEKDAMPESKEANDIYEYYEISPDYFPFKIEYIVKDTPYKSYFDENEIELVSMIDSKSSQNFTVKNSINYSNYIEVLNLNPLENIIAENDINNSITLQNLPFESITVDDQKLHEDIWEEVDRFSFPVHESRTEVYLKYKDTRKELQRELISVVLSILIGAALSVFLTIFLTPTKSN